MVALTPVAALTAALANALPSRSCTRPVIVTSVSVSMSRMIVTPLIVLLAPSKVIVTGAPPQVLVPSVLVAIKVTDESFTNMNGPIEKPPPAATVTAWPPPVTTAPSMLTPLASVTVPLAVTAVGIITGIVKVAALGVLPS